MKRWMMAGVLGGMMALLYWYAQSGTLYMEVRDGGQTFENSSYAPQGITDTAHNTQFSLQETPEGYELSLYDVERREIFSEVYPKEPWIKEISEGILEIGISVGSPARYTFYFRKEDGRISDTFFNAKVFGERYIAYRQRIGYQWDEPLILTDIFEEGFLYQEIHRDFSETADPMSAIYSIELADEDHVIVEYCEGEDYTVVNEEVELENTKPDREWVICDLPQEEYPDYLYFANAGEGHYRLPLEYGAAIVVKDYAYDAGMEEEVWELKRLSCCSGVYQAFVESASGNELYLLFSEGKNVEMWYIVLADIRKGDQGDVALGDGNYSYHSMLDWHSYKELWEASFTAEDSAVSQSGLQVTDPDSLHDHMYFDACRFAIYDYLDRTGGEFEGRWTMDNNGTYVGRNGYIACVSFTNGDRQINLAVDVSNDLYAVWE